MANYVHSKKEITLAGPRPARKPHRFFFIFYMKNLNRKRPNRKIENSPNPMRPLSFLMTFIAPLSDFGLDLVFPESDVINSVTI